MHHYQLYLLLGLLSAGCFNPEYTLLSRRYDEFRGRERKVLVMKYYSRYSSPVAGYYFKVTLSLESPDSTHMLCRGNIVVRSHPMFTELGNAGFLKMGDQVLPIEIVVAPTGYHENHTEVMDVNGNTSIVRTEYNLLKGRFEIPVAEIGKLPVHQPLTFQCYVHNEPVRIDVTDEDDLDKINLFAVSVKNAARKALKQLNR